MPKMRTKRSHGLARAPEQVWRFICGISKTSRQHVVEVLASLQVSEFTEVADRVEKNAQELTAALRGRREQLGHKCVQAALVAAPFFASERFPGKADIRESTNSLEHTSTGVFCNTTNCNG